MMFFGVAVRKSSQLLFLIAFCFQFFQVAYGAQGENDTHGVFATVEQFRADPEARKYRHNYESIIKKLSEFYESNKNHHKADQALWIIASLKEDVASITRKREAWEQAYKAYVKVSEKALIPIFAESAKSKATEIKKEHLSQPIEKKVEVAQALDGTIKNINSSISGKDTVVNFDFTKPVTLKYGLIPANEKQAKRLYLDVSDVVINKAFSSTMEIESPGVKKIRSGQFREKTARFVVELTGDSKAYVFENPDGKGFQIQVKPELQEEAIAKAETKVREIEDEAPSVNDWLFKTIVLDPGHGGSDPGAIGRTGVREKDVTLAIAKKVKNLLKRQLPNVKVYLTRNNDTSIPLAKRSEYANNREADLFISIHANSSPNRNTQGIETYYLNISHDRYAIRLAARENTIDESSVSDLEFILADLSMKSNVTESVHLSNMIQSSVVSKVSQKWRDARDLGVKHALFHVLLGAKMPAILIETSFLSNRAEEKRLKSGKYQQTLAEGIVKGIRRYVEEKQATLMPEKPNRES